MLPRKLCGGAPLDQVAHHLAADILHHHVDERVWIAKLERDEIALDGHRLTFEVRRGKRVMGVRPCASEEREYRQPWNNDSLHATYSYHAVLNLGNRRSALPRSIISSNAFDSFSSDSGFTVDSIGSGAWSVPKRICDSGINAFIAANGQA